MLDLKCPLCGTDKLHGPAVIQLEDEEYRYYDCNQCHSLVIEHPDGTLEAKAGAW
jgi:DNA-directed RNA polymerase subunit RPC12/RpoP